MNKQKTLLITFLVHQRTKSQKKTASLFLVKLVLTKANRWQMPKMLKKTETKRREIQMVSFIHSFIHFIHLKIFVHGILSDKNLISRGVVLSNSKSIYNVFTVFNKVPLNQCQAGFKTLFRSMVYLNRFF